MGVVYRAQDRLEGTTVALKALTTAPSNLLFQSRASIMPTQQPDAADLLISDIDRLALAREFRTLARLRHPYIISVLDYGQDAERRPFYTMTLLQGAQPLTVVVDNVARVDRMLQLLSALTYLHRHGIIHCDLKPSNLLVVGDRAYLTDFGWQSSWAFVTRLLGRWRTSRQSC